MLGWLKRRKRKRAPWSAYLSHKEEARTVVQDRLKYFSGQYGFAYKRVAIRDTRRSWGSCSSKGNLNFSYKLLFLSPCLRDYIIVHELCHLRYLDHSQNFWREVAAIMPDYKARMKYLRQMERVQGTSVKSLRSLEKEMKATGICNCHT